MMSAVAPPSSAEGHVVPAVAPTSSAEGHVVPAVAPPSVAEGHMMSAVAPPPSDDPPGEVTWSQTGEELLPADGSLIRDGDVEEVHLERRWVLWHDFMKEHAHLDAWLRLAEQAVSSSKPAHFTYAAAKEELRAFERLRREAGLRLVQLDGLTRRNRTLTRLFEGAMRARLLAAARDCGRRWDDVNGRLEAIVGGLQVFMLEWEEFDDQREELALWLADMEVSLSEVDQLRGSSCEKLRQLQSFQQRVCVNWARVSGLLQRGEALIQRSQPPDAQRVESHLLELLRNCNRIYNNISRTHTRLLSMRLATDSGCPSESFLEEEGALQTLHLDVPAAPSSPQSVRRCPLHQPPSSPSPEQQFLEWDPSVDVGRSLSPDDADSSYCSASTGLCRGDGALKRWSLLGSLDSGSSDSVDMIQGSLDRVLPGIGEQDQDRWTTSTPDRLDGEPGFFPGGRVEAWLGVQSPAQSQTRTSRSRAVQTDENKQLEATPPSDWTSLGTTPPSDWMPLGATPPSDWMTPGCLSGVQAEAESTCQEAERLPSEQSSSRYPPWCPPALLYLLLSVALVLLACVWWLFSEPSCRRGVRLPRTINLALRYVNGPPPT
ncbi:nesprin-2 isoform X3 [Salarias fasciatus]|uniref:nesprin-2 isoform X3 n=1 Tax=Salarias fasciatus TaxID=181472 RepID=UPI0011768DAC|nr:nesprin-2-like isoform X3 [Salarias fasciatus]